MVGIGGDPVTITMDIYTWAWVAAVALLLVSAGFCLGLAAGFAAEDRRRARRDHPSTYQARG
jgi:predicted transporter